MKKKHFEQLQPGEIVVIVARGRNKGKRGIVREVVQGKYGGLGVAFLEPYLCEFEFADDKRGLQNDQGFYGWNSLGIKHEKERWDKKFYIGQMCHQEGISWCADGFTQHELGVIERFLEQFNERVSGTYVDSVAILDCEED